MNNLVVENIGQLVTLEPIVRSKRFHSILKSDLGILEKAWLIVGEDGKVRDSGQGTLKKDYESIRNRYDAKGGLVMPGLVDCHTHPIFGGDRSEEFAARLDGATYQEIAARGGGINNTVKKTRTASDEVLLESTVAVFEKMRSHGVTTIEAKSGYGLSVDEEMRLLRILKKAKQKTKQHISVTCLALHAVPSEFASTQAFVDEMTSKLLPKVKAEGLADFVDAFVEAGYFSVQDALPFLNKAKELGLKIRLHADEFSDSGAAALAAKVGALCADHMQFASEAGISALAKSGAAAVLLPGTSLYTGIAFAKAKRFRDNECPIAVASDFNPGSCQIDNLSLVASVGAVHCGLTTAEAVAGVTLVAAKTLGLEQNKGALVAGFDADFVHYSLTSVEQWIADFGRTKPKRVWLGGH